MHELKKKKININAFVLIFSVIIVCAIASYFVSPGAFERQVVDGRTIVVPGSFHETSRSPLSLFDIFRAVPNGLIGASNVVFLVLIVGGSIEIYNKSGSISAGISLLVNSAGDKGGLIVITMLMIMFAILGGFLGWIEAAIPFVPIVIPIVLALGYDSMTAVAVCILGCMVGFAVGPTNVYTVGIAHSVAELPMFSGFGFRILAYITFVCVSIIYTLRYATKVKKDPSKSLVLGIDVSDIKYDFSKDKDKTMNSTQKLALIILILTFIFVVYGMIKLKWNINDMSAAFLLSGIVAGLICKMNADTIATTFISGAKASMSGAMIVGVARGVQWTLEKGGIIDPIINSMDKVLHGLPPWASVIGVMVLVTLLNGLVASGSAKAMALMPLLIPLSDLIGITRQTMTLAYQFGDGISNIFWFSYGTLLIFLSYGKVPLTRWYKFLMPLFGIFIILSIMFLFIAINIGYGPF
ncbi:YfcC family protein [Clostridium sp. MSJ-11]|uniref:YfcC family protein n=1 Tax=Clostridium mobile TaxID=2841512 RepID=A0ABS6EHZ0_9CLOT|nr:YfcC family protein [Clostridium mobile]MBU5484832.1 YfcC family protein [Clostridium mobile]